MDREFRRIIEKAYDYCRENVDPHWIIEPEGDLMGVFKGILFGSLDSQIPGTAFAFTLEIDHANLAAPPKVHFEKPINHPFTFKVGQTPGCYFCLPQEITCRSDMKVILENLYINFFLAVKNAKRIIMKPAKLNLTNAIDKDMVKKMNTEKYRTKFWDDLKQDGTLANSSSNVAISSTEVNDEQTPESEK